MQYEKSNSRVTNMFQQITRKKLNNTRVNGTSEYKLSRKLYCTSMTLYLHSTCKFKGNWLCYVNDKDCYFITKSNNQMAVKWKSLPNHFYNMMNATTFR